VHKLPIRGSKFKKKLGHVERTRISLSRHPFTLSAKQVNECSKCSNDDKLESWPCSPTISCIEL
jgi:hypothetical protein